MEQSTKRRIFLVVKLVATVAVVTLILRAVLKKEDADELLGHLRTMDYRWFGLAVGVQLFQVFVGTLRFTRLLDGQGIKVARRTVAKYREALNILPSHLRKSFS